MQRITAFIAILSLATTCAAQTVVSPIITDTQHNGTQTTMRFPLQEGVQSYGIFTTTNLSQPFVLNTNFNLVPYYGTNIIYSPPQFIIDNQSAAVIGSWTLNNPSTDKFGADYRYKSQGSGASFLHFAPNIALAGEYDVYEWHPQGSNRTTNAPHVINYSGGTATVYVNQQVNGGKWNLLGRFNFTTGTGGYVRIYDNFADSSKVVLADAIKFVGVGLPAQPVPVLELQGYEWSANEPRPAGFYRVQVIPMSTNDVLAAMVLNRLTFGPTPDELARISTIGPDAYINEQLAPESITEDINQQHTNINIIEAKMAAADEPVTTSSASLEDLRAWHTIRAVGARRQLLEVLLQFLENHFVTQYTKSTEYFQAYYDNATLEGRLAAQLEQLENSKWRTALLNPSCTFYDLLKVSVESPAMIIYLDTVTSRGDSSRTANENFARELMELFTFGVDNGYDQNDIVECSKCWTGWRVEIVDPVNAFNPFAARTTNNLPGVTNNFTATSNLLGCWSFNYKSTYHNNNAKTIFSNKFVPARFGAPWANYVYPSNTVAGKYQLTVPARSGTNAIQDGYDVIRHLSNLPFTQEYISVKLCRLLVHDDFYLGYDFTSTNLSPEAKLVKNCMLAWQNGSPKGQIRDVLRVIFNSELFRSQGGAMQKVKTPLEFVISAIRALHSSTDGSYSAGSFTSDTDGYSLTTPLARMGGMALFNRSDPDGYPETAPGWISAGTITERVRFVQSYCIGSGQSGHTGAQSGTGNDASNTSCNPVELLKQNVPSADWTNAGVVADYFLGVLFPGEGAGNLKLYRQAALEFLDTGDNGVSSPFSGLSVSSTAGSTYDTRVRGMVALLMSTQRFQEQ